MPRLTQAQAEAASMGDFSVETPQDFMTHNKHHDHHDHEEDYDGASSSINTNTAASDDEGQYVRHGRSRCFYLTIGAIVLVLVAVGGGVGVALSGGDGGSSAQTAAAQGQGSSSGSFADDNNNNSLDGGAPGGGGGSSSYNGEVSVVESTQEYAGGTPAPTSEIFDIIMSYARYHGVEFNDPDSYQSKAVKWVEETAVPGLHSPERLVQRYALACLYFSTNSVSTMWTDSIFGEGNIRGWIDESGWLDDDDECTWYKIQCNENGQVTHILLYNNRLTGSLPPELAILNDSLIEIDLYNNPIHNYGDEGNHWLGELTNIRKLFFGRTFFEYDGIPTVIGNLAQLEEFDCSYTLYHGPLRGETFAYTNNLVYLYIGGNAYNSTIPAEIARLPNLEFLYAEYADLKGNISFITEMPEIKELWIDRNPMMKGTIPTEIGLVSNLKSFSVTDCGLTGTLPTELAQLRLQQFWCYSNDLTGEIPTELGGVQSLMLLGLENNTFVGSMPDEICANRAPSGLLSKLEADCQEVGGTVDCDCCTCCGPECISDTSTGSRRMFI